MKRPPNRPPRQHLFGHTVVALSAVVALVLAAVLLLAIGQGLAVQREAGIVAHRAGALYASYRAGEPLPLEEVRALRRDLERLDARLRRLRGATEWLSGPLARQRLWPGVARVMMVLHDGLGASVDLSAAAWWTALAVESAVEAHGTVNVASGVPVLMEADVAQTVGRALSAQRATLLAAWRKLVDAADAFEALGLGGSRWGRYAAVGPLGVDGLLVAGGLLREDRPQNYLVLIQNNDELRATGGFVSSVAFLRLEGQRLTSVEYLNSKDVEAFRAVHPSPPEPLAQYMHASVLLLRDGNWSPDFPTSAEVVASLYTLDMGERVDGVIAFDATFVRELLRALGPLEVPRYGVTVTDETMMDLVVGFWERPLDAPAITEGAQNGRTWLEHRKDFGGALLQAGLARLAELSPQQLADILAAVQTGIHGRHLLAWHLADEHVQADLMRAGLSGHLEQTDGDYMLVVDSNVGWNKADRNVERHVRYSVALVPEGLLARATVTYRNTSTPSEQACVHRSYYDDSYEGLANRCYWNYVRLLVPGGSRLVRVAGAIEPVDVGREQDRSVFGTLVVVPPAEERAVTFEYLLPGTLCEMARVRGTYHLLVQKQAGSVGATFAFHLAAPDDPKLRLATAGGRERTARGVVGPLPLDADLRIDATWRSDR